MLIKCVKLPLQNIKNYLNKNMPNIELLDGKKFHLQINRWFELAKKLASHLKKLHYNGS